MYKKEICKPYSSNYFLGGVRRKDSRAIKGCKGKIARIRDRWIDVFYSYLGYDIYRLEDFETVNGLLTEM